MLDFPGHHLFRNRGLVLSSRSQPAVQQQPSIERSHLLPGVLLARQVGSTLPESLTGHFGSFLEQIGSIIQEESKWDLGFGFVLFQSY